MLRLPPLPTLPRPPAPASFPIIAVVAPLAAAVVIGLITGSAFVLVFAVLSPLIAVATVLDGRRLARRHRALESERFAKECAAFALAIERAHAREREHADVEHPLLTAPAVAADGGRRTELVRIGVAPARSAVAPEAPLVLGETADERTLRGLIDQASTHPALPVLVPRGPIAVRGGGAAAANLVRRLALEPGCTTRLVGADDAAPPDHVLIDVMSARRVRVRVREGLVLEAVPEFVTRLDCAAVLSRRDRGEPPSTVSWAQLHPHAEVASSAGAASSAAGDPPTHAVVIGHDGDEPVLLDLVRDGPHALVGGTTGSGKSEFLRSLALGWARGASPEHLQLLLVDFKGGATFSALVDLPHTVGLITDLDPVIAERTLLGLRAELQRRERLLVDLGVRDAAEAPQRIPRLLVLVDEFAALIDAFPGLQAPFADLSARGRSLGVHLVLGTQHPAAVVRDTVAANCAIRVAFRLPDAAGSAFLGASGRGLSSAPPGRALIATADRERRVQIAVADDADIAAVARSWHGSAVAERPWQPPLPRRITRAEAEQHLADREPAALGPVFGIIDDPGELRRTGGRWNPAHDGPIAVIGSSGSGRTTALDALAASSGFDADRQVALPLDVPAAWSMLEEVAAGDRPADLLIADDLDLLVAAAAEVAPELLARWDGAVRSIRRHGGTAIASVGPATTSRPVLGARFPQRLLLRALDADDHALAGAPRGLFDRGAAPGRGWWLDREVQVIADPPRLAPSTVEAPVWQPPPRGVVAVVARRVEQVSRALAGAMPMCTVQHGVPDTTALSHSSARTLLQVAHPDDWQSAWASLAAHRRDGAVLVAGGDPADLRSLLAMRSVPPPLAPERGEAWLIEPGAAARRVRLAGLETT